MVTGEVRKFAVLKYVAVFLISILFIRGVLFKDLSKVEADDSDNFILKSPEAIKRGDLDGPAPGLLLSISPTNDTEELALLYAKLTQLKQQLLQMKATLGVSGPISYATNVSNSYVDKKIEELEGRMERQFDVTNDSGDSDLGDYLKKTGGTLTGALTGTSINLSGALTVGGATSLGGVSYTWPGSDGTSGQVLSTDGSGTLSWTTASGGFSGGELVAEYITATSSSATSTFAGHVSVATDKEYRINGSGVLSMPGSSNQPLIVGDHSGNSRGGLAVDIQANRGSLTQVASGFASIALGNRVTASGNYSTAIGWLNSASSYYALGVGYQADALGSYSTALGYNAQADGQYATSLGAGSRAQGSYSLSLGYFTDAQSSGSSAIGQGVINSTSNSLMIGPSNSAKMTILGAAGSVGFTGIGTTTPQYALHVVRSTDGDVAGFTDSNGTCTVDPTTTSLVCSSDRNLKKDILEIDGSEAINIVTSLNPVTFRWRDQESPTPRYGLIAQDVEEILPEIVSEQKNGYKSISYSSLTPIAISAIKELELKLSDLESKVGQNLIASDGTPSNFFVGWLRSIGVFLSDGLNSIKRLVVTEEICIDDVCIDETDLRTILEASNINKNFDPSPRILNPEALGEEEPLNEDSDVVVSATTTENEIEPEEIDTTSTSTPEEVVDIETEDNKPDENIEEENLATTTETSQVIE